MDITPLVTLMSNRRRTLNKRLDLLIPALYYGNCTNIQIPMLEIPTIFRRARAAYVTAMDAEADVKSPEAIERAVLATQTEIVDYVNTIRCN